MVEEMTACVWRWQAKEQPATAGHDVHTKSFFVHEGEATMRLFDTIKGESARSFCETVLRMDPAEFDLDAVNRVEVHCTDIQDDEDDYSKYVVYDCLDQVMTVRRELGY